MMIRFLLVCGVVLSPACVAHEQRQYFEVVDPETGNVNYYRMVISGSAGLGADYQLQAGYFSAASVDVLRGGIPEIPEADLPIENDAAVDILTGRYYDALVAMGQTVAPQGETLDEAVLRHARLAWFGRMSPADVAAMGMTQTTNPFEFRKLVFWASASNVDLRAYGSEIDAMIDSATTLVRARRAAHRAQADQRRNIRDFVAKLVASQPALAPYADAVNALLAAPTPGP